MSPSGLPSGVNAGPEYNLPRGFFRLPETIGYIVMENDVASNDDQSLRCASHLFAYSDGVFL